MPELSKHQRRILEVLAKRKGWTTRKDIVAVTGNPKGYSKAIGAPTRGKPKPESLEGRKMVVRKDMTMPFEYKITDVGRAELKRRDGLPF